MSTSLIQLFSDGFVLEHAHRRGGLARYRVPLGVVIPPRNPHAKARAIGAVQHRGEGAHEVLFVGPPRTRSLLSSFVRDYAIEPYRLPPDHQEAPLPHAYAFAAVGAPGAPADAPAQIAHPGKGDRPQPSGAERAAPAVVAESTPPVLADHGPGSAASSPPPEYSIVRRELVSGRPVAYSDALGSEAPLVRDLDLAEWAGLANPRGIRDTIRRLAETGEISVGAGGAHRRALAVVEEYERGKGSIGQATTFYLDEAAALHVVVLLRTPRAVELRRELVDTFLAARRGARLDERVVEVLDGLRSAVLTERDRVGALERALLELTQVVMRSSQPPALPPGTVTIAPGGSVTKAPPPVGYLSQRAVADQAGLPSRGDGRGLVGTVARVSGAWDDPSCVHHGSMITGTNRLLEHRLLGPRAIDRMAPGLKAARITMVELGWSVRGGVLSAATSQGAERTAGWVAKEMLASATRALLPPALTSQTAFGLDS